MLSKISAGKRLELERGGETGIEKERNTSSRGRLRDVESAALAAALADPSLTAATNARTFSSTALSGKDI